MSFFKEDNGNWSMTRLIVFIGSLWAMFLTSILLYMAIKSDMDGLQIGSIVGFFVSAMGVFAAWKTKSKQSEVKFKSIDQPDKPPV